MNSDMMWDFFIYWFSPMFLMGVGLTLPWLMWKTFK